MNASTHRQVEISHGKWNAHVDEGVAELILELWRAGAKTKMSCQKSFGRYTQIPSMMSCRRHELVGMMWVSFESESGVRRFVNAVTSMGPNVDAKEIAIEGVGSIGVMDIESLDHRVAPAFGPHDRDAFTEQRAWHYTVSPADRNAVLEQDEETGQVIALRSGPPDFRSEYNVWFPPSDYPEVLERMKRFNARAAAR